MLKSMLNSTLSPRWTRWWMAGALLALAALLAACGTKATPAAGPAPAALLAQIPAPAANGPQLANTFLGAVPGSNYYVGLVIDGDTAVGYLCDGQTDAWLKGKVEGDQITLTSDDGATLKATLSGSTLTGTVTPAGGTALNFTANPQQGDGGLFRTTVVSGDYQYVGGWIILEDGTRGFLRRIFGGGNSGGGGGGGTGGGGGGSGTANDPCNEAQKRFDNYIAMSGDPNLSAQQRQQALANADIELATAGDVGCIISPFGGGDQP